MLSLSFLLVLSLLTHIVASAVGQIFPAPQVQRQSQWRQAINRLTFTVSLALSEQH